MILAIIVASMADAPSKMPLIAFFDIEVNPKSEQILDVGCLLSDGSTFHKNQLHEFEKFVERSDFFCGHNIIKHDLDHLQKRFGNVHWGLSKSIDTLQLSPLLFPQNPYHNLVKDDKLQSDDLSNPLNDSIKAKDLFYDEVAAFQKLDNEFKTILYLLLSNKTGCDNFFRYLGYSSSQSITELISGEEVKYEEDSKMYPAPQQIAMYLTHKDVYLGYFEFVQHRMRDIISGTSLFVMEEGLGNLNRELLVKYSKKFRDDLQDRIDKGFSISEAKVNFIVYWKDEEKGKEMKIILPQLLFKKDL